MIDPINLYEALDLERVEELPLTNLPLIDQVAAKELIKLSTNNTQHRKHK